jgi:hypothetical protein
MRSKRASLCLVISLLIHCVVLSYLPSGEIPTEADASTEYTAVLLADRPPPRATPSQPNSVSPPPRKAPAHPMNTARPHKHPSAAMTPRETASKPSGEKNREWIPPPDRPVVGPPRPSHLSLLSLPAAPERLVERKKEAPDELRARIRSEKGFSIVYSDADGNRVSHEGEPNFQTGDSNATGSGRISGGIGFNFYSPPDFNQEMARAREKVRVDGENHRLEKFTNPGHGVICNTEGSWFLCKKKAIDACNAAHDNMCRYATKEERDAIDQTVVF